MTPALDGRILPGVTRTVLLELARDLGVEIELRTPIPRFAGACGGQLDRRGALDQALRGSTARSDYDGPGELLTELSQRLVARWTRRRYGRAGEQQGLYT